MPYGDRYWWLKLSATPLAAALAVAAPWWYAATIAPADQAVGISASADRWFTIGLGVALGLTALYLLVSGLRGRVRVRRRRAAIAGDHEAVPRSSVEVDPDDAPDAEHLPMKLLWQARGVNRWFSGCFTSSISVIVIFSGILLVVGVFRDLITGHVPTTNNSVPFGLIFVGGLAFAFGGFIVARRALAALFGRRVGVVADHNGITVYPLWGRQRRMRWEEMRLYEISLPIWAPSKQQAPLYITLYSQRGSLRWRENWKSKGSDGLSFGSFAPEGITEHEMVRREIHLENLIAARTGLRVRTFSRRLGGGVITPAGLQVQMIANSVIGGCLFGGLAALVLAAPLTPVRWLDAVFATPLVILVLACLFQLARHVRTLALPITTDPTFAYTYRQPESSTTQVEDIKWHVLTTERPLWWSLLLFAYGLLLVLEAAPFLMLQLPGHFAWLQPEGPLIASGLPTALAVTLLLPGLCGLLLVLFAFIARRVTINADESSLDNMNNTLTAGIPWSQVTSVVVDLRHGQPKRYTVLGRSSSAPISWPATLLGAQQIADSEDDIQPITPAALAELVARRTGVPISRREG